MMKTLLLVSAVWAWLACQLTAAPLDTNLVRVLERAYFQGREYFVLRSGRAQMVVQADQADLAPAVLYLLFDAQDSRQSSRKEFAFNFGAGQGFVNSSLEVVLGGFPYTALGHQTKTRWVQVDGIPAVEAVWWAGGLRVTERLLAVADKGIFVRRVELASVNLGGLEQPRLRLKLPPAPCLVKEGLLVQENAGFRLALGLAGQQPNRAIAEHGLLEVGPLSIRPGQTTSVDTLLLVQIQPAEVSSGLRDPAGAAFVPMLAPESLPAGTTLASFALGNLLEQTRLRWANGSSVVTDDAVVREVFDKARFGLPGMVGDNGTMNAGIFEYGAQWVRDTSNTLLGMVHAGHFELARQGLAHILKNMVNQKGQTMIAGAYDDPDREQFDQMGELIHALKAYRDWTGDDSLIREHRAKLTAMVERPFRPEFRDATGMVHNRREFWERTLEDAYELAYQTYVVLGWREAAALAEPLGAADRAVRWRAEADRTQQALLSHPSRALIEQGRLIKRRGLDGQWVKSIRFPAAAPDVPLRTEQVHLSEPDATMALPIAFGLVEARSVLALKTLDEVEKLWGARWFGGGYERYHSSGQCDQPGPWTFASCFILRAQHEAGLFARSRRTLEWLNTMQGGRTGAWFEEIPLVRSQASTAGILPWTSGEISLFIVRHLLGVRFERDRLVVKPALYPNSPPVHADLRFRRGRLKLEITAAGAFQFAEVNGRRLSVERDGALRLPADFEGGTITLRTGE
jgi:hypothetical protein